LPENSNERTVAIGRGNALLRYGLKASALKRRSGYQ